MSVQAPSENLIVVGRLIRMKISFVSFPKMCWQTEIETFNIHNPIHVDHAQLHMLW